MCLLLSLLKDFKKSDGLLVWSAYKVHVCVIVAKIFYCGGSFGRLGVLRAVMPLSDLKPLMFVRKLGLRWTLGSQKRTKKSSPKP